MILLLPVTYIPEVNETRLCSDFEEDDGNASICLNLEDAVLGGIPGQKSRNVAWFYLPKESQNQSQQKRESSDGLLCDVDQEWPGYGLRAWTGDGESVITMSP